MLTPISIRRGWNPADNAELWRWLNSPRAPNFDDYGPATPVLFLEEMDRRSVTELRWTVLYGAQAAGFIAFQPQSLICGMFHGVVMAPEARGRGIGLLALQLVVADLVEHGFVKLMASFFADNEPIRRTFAKIGFVEEGYLTAATRRDGQPVDMRILSLPGKDAVERTVEHLEVI